MICTKCNIEKPEAEFYIEKRTGRPLQRCKECVREAARDYRRRNSAKISANKKANYNAMRPQTQERNIKRKLLSFNMTREEYDELRVYHQDKCAICGREQKTKTKYGYTQLLAIDHDHETDRVRGLLCNRCNLGIGSFNDSIELLEAAITYLQDYASRTSEGNIWKTDEQYDRIKFSGKFR